MIRALNGPDMAGLGLPQRIQRVVVRAMTAGGEPFNTLELSPDDWQTLCDHLEARESRMFRVEVGTTKPALYWALFGNTFRVVPSAAFRGECEQMALYQEARA